MDQAEPIKLDTRCLVTTAEHTAFQYYLAGVFERMMACALDHLFLLIGFMVIAITASFLALSLGMELGPFVQSLLILLAVVVAWLYFVVLEGLWNGKTLGKRIMRIRVVAVQGTPIHFRQALVRNLLRVVDMLPHLGSLGNLAIFPFYGLGFVSCFVTQKNQRLGDLAAGTMVVQENRGYLNPLRASNAPAQDPMLNGMPAHCHFSRQEARAIVSYVQRSNVFGPSRREEMVRPLAAKLRKKYPFGDIESDDRLIQLCYQKYFRGEA